MKAIVFSLISLAVLATSAHAEFEVRVIARRGFTQLPLPDGSTLAYFSFNVSHHSDGEQGAYVTSNGTTYFGGVGHQWRAQPNGSITRILSVGEQAPGFPTGVVFGPGRDAISPDRLGLASSDRFFYYSRLTGPGITVENNDSIWCSGNGQLSLVMRDGDIIESISPTARIFYIEPTQLIERSGVCGLVDLVSVSDGANSRNNVLIRGKHGDYEVLQAGIGQPAPGLPGTFVEASRVKSNDRGQLIFWARFSGPGINTSNDEAVWWADSSSALQPMLREGEVISGLSARCDQFSEESFGLGPRLFINSMGRVGVPVFARNSQGVLIGDYYSNGAGLPEVNLLGVESGAHPMTDMPPTILNDGTIIYGTTFNVNNILQGAIRRKRPGQEPQTLIESGMQVPRLAPGITLAPPKYLEPVSRTYEGLGWRATTNQAGDVMVRGHPNPPGPQTPYQWVTLAHINDAVHAISYPGVIFEHQGEQWPLTDDAPVTSFGGLNDNGFGYRDMQFQFVDDNGIPNRADTSILFDPSGSSRIAFSRSNAYGAGWTTVSTGESLPLGNCRPLKLTTDNTYVFGCYGYNNGPLSSLVSVRDVDNSSCSADFDQSGSVTIQDIFAFLNAWFVLAPIADFNSSEDVTVQDLFDYLDAWFAGC